MTYINVTATNSTTNETYTYQSKKEKKWTFFDFDPSYVEYYYYKDCVVK